MVISEPFKLGAWLNKPSGKHHIAKPDWRKHCFADVPRNYPHAVSSCSEWIAAPYNLNSLSYLPQWYSSFFPAYRISSRRHESEGSSQRKWWEGDTRSVRACSSQ
jgi:hypothetical protein